MLIAWTTLPAKDIAERLAADAVAARLAVCVQIEGPVRSHYVWQGTAESSSEYRLTFKLLPDQAAPLESWLHERHPYETPEWIVVRCEHVSEKYLSWARANSSN